MINTTREVADAPVVVVGAGPAGVRAVQEIERLNPAIKTLLYGEEHWDPYNRVRLSSFMAAQIGQDALSRDQIVPKSVERRLGCKVVAIDAHARSIVEDTGRRQTYSRLVLATGSSPFVPDIPGIKSPGVYTFRDLNDAQKLFARQVRSRRTVVLGGGLLGLEAARGMQRFNTEVCIVELASHLMPRQLDPDLAGYLKTRVEAMGIKVLLGDAVERILADDAVSGIMLKSERVISCDTIVVATGIVPRVDLACTAGLEIGRGVLVDEYMRTSDPYIYAVGECSQHPERRGARGTHPRIYGAAAPSLEQARIAAHMIAANSVPYAGGPVATRLKVLDIPVFSMGRISGETLRGAKSWCYRNDQAGAYRKLVTCHGKLVGALAVGEWSDLGRIQGAMTQNLKVWPWQFPRFHRTGSLWRDAAPASVADWPATAAVCNCANVTRGQLGAAMAQGHHTVKQLAAVTGASTVCGTCRPLLAELVGGAAVLEPVPAHRRLLMTALTALALVLLLILPPNIAYPHTLNAVWQWDDLWRDNTLKQISGYSVVALIAVGLALLVVKKRILRTRGDFGASRWIHIVLSVTAMLAIVIHTGGRLGSGINFWLIACLLSLILAGAAMAGVIAVEHRLQLKVARGLRVGSTWLHVLLFWPIPVLLAFHVAASYYF